MAPHYSNPKKDRIAQQLSLNLTNRIVREVEKVSRRCVQSIKRKLDTYNHHSTPKELDRRGRPTAITPAAMLELKTYLDHRPWAYQDEMIIYLYDDWGILCSQSTMSKTLKSNRIFRKIIQREALERSQQCRDDYMVSIFELSNSKHQLCFLDEFVANEHTCHRKHGWSLFGITFRVILSVKRLERHSVLPCYDINGIMCYHIHQEAIDEPRFEWFLDNHVLSRCNSYSSPRFVLVMDNASIYRHLVSNSLKLRVY